MSQQKAADDRTFESLTVGEVCTREHHLDKHTVDSFAALSGDTNPLHTDEKYARSAGHAHPVVHGMLLGAFVSELIGMHLPGKRSLIVKQTLEFRRPVITNDVVRIVGTVVRKSAAVQLVEMKIAIKRSDELVSDGVVYVKILPQS